jgi:four helix bundle protein
MEYERPANLFFRFEDLRIYNKSLDYVSWVYSNTQLFPDSEKQGITAKFIGTAQSISINIAEGSGRNKTQFIYYLKMAKSGIRECIVLTTICQKLSFLSEVSVEESRNFLIEMTRMIGALIASLQKSERMQGRQDYNNDNNTDDYDVLPPDNGNVM